MLLCLAPIVAFAAYKLQIGSLPPVLGSAAANPQLLQNYLVGGLFAAHLIGFNAVSPCLGALLSRMERPIRWAAGATFSIYLFHLPVAQFLSVLVPWAPQRAATRAIVLGGTLALCLLAAEVAERRKEAWRHAIERLVARSRGPGLAS